MKAVLLVLLLLVVAGLAWVRLAPSDPERWHTDPAGAAPGPGRYVVGPPPSDAASPVLPLPPAEALQAVDRIALSEPRTRRLAGSPEAGRITYVTRSRLFGFPDYTTVAARPAAGGAELLIHARLRFGYDDLGVNRARVSRWLAALGAS